MAGKMHARTPQQQEVHALKDRELFEQFLQGECLGFSNLRPVGNAERKGPRRKPGHSNQTRMRSPP